MQKGNIVLNDKPPEKFHLSPLYARSLEIVNTVVDTHCHLVRSYDIYNVESQFTIELRVRCLLTV